MKYEYLVEWDYQRYYGSGGYRVKQKYSTLIWAVRRFREKAAYRPTILRRPISSWEVVPVDEFPPGE